VIISHLAAETHVGQRSASGVKQTMPGNKIIDGGAHETVAEDI